MTRIALLATLASLALAGPSMSARAEGEPDVGFGVQGFVRYERSPIPEEPNIERGVQLRLRADGNLLALAQHRFQDGDAANHALIALFDADGALLQDRLFAASAFFDGADPAVKAATIDAAGRALFLGDAGGGSLLQVLIADPVFHAASLDAQIPATPGSGDRHRAVVGLADGRWLACGMHSAPFGAGQSEMPLCRMFAASGAIAADFGNASPFVPPGSFYLNELDLPGLQAGRVLSVQQDAVGRFLLGGALRIAGFANDLVLSARLLANGTLDLDYCGAGQCGDAAASAPGWRADAIADVASIDESASIVRPDGAILQVLDVRLQSASQFAAAVILYAQDGSRAFESTLLLGEWTRVGAQLAVQPDDRVVVPISYRPDASTQLGALLRIPADPEQDGLFDASVEYAPAGVDAIAGVSVLQPLLEGGVPATSVECNAVLLESARATCAGLVRVAAAPLNLDMLLARVAMETGLSLFDDGFD